MEGMHRFLKRLWRLYLTLPTHAEKDIEARGSVSLRRQIHKTIRKVTENIERIHFNTAISAIIELLNAAYVQENDAADVTNAVETIVLLLAPFAPHIAEELWHRRGHSDSVHHQPWPRFDPEIARTEETTVVIQVNGKLRDRMVVPTGTTEDEVKEVALERERVKQWITGRKINRIIVIQDKQVNIVVDG